MKRGLVLLFVLLFSVSFVFAQNGWGDINVEDDVDNGSGVEEAVSDEVSDDDYVSPPASSRRTPGSSGKYTREFYVALGVAGVGILIAAFFVYLFLRNPKNKWK